ncbi:MAG: calcium-binding protein [Albidovulum sp.]
MLMLAGILGAVMTATILDVFSFGDDPPEAEDTPEKNDEASTQDDGLDGSPLEDIDIVRADNGGSESPEMAVATAGIAETGSEGGDTLAGTADDDRLSGAGGNDIIAGYAGDDRLFGGAGHDDISGDAGDDLLDGGDGDDTIVGGNDSDSLIGGAGDDSLAGQMGHDSILGGDGDDALIGGAGDDTLAGGAGDDALQGGDGGDVLDGGTGQDTLMGGNGDDVLTDRDTADAPIRDFLNGGAGNDTIVAGEADWVEGGEGADDFILNAWLAEPHANATIGDYDHDEDQIVVVYDPADYPDPVLTLNVTNAETGDVEILLNGNPIAHVLASPDLAVDDLALVPTSAPQPA